VVAVEMKLPFKFKLDDNDAKVYQEVQNMPVFAGCDAENLEGDALKSCSNSKLFEFIGKEMRYPEIAAKDGVEGMVIVSFIVEKDGSVSNLNAMKGIGGGCEEEVLRVIYSMPNWIPGQKDGKAVRTEMRLPVKFVLDNAEEMNKKPLTSDLTLADFRLGPNPTKDQIDLQFKSDARAISIRVFDLNGKVIYTEQDQNFSGFYQNSIMLNAAPEGTYFVQVRQDGKAMTRKIVKQ
ncbi:MAG: TonB family protein, partial [Bacteroidota bacterium]